MSKQTTLELIRAAKHMRESEETLKKAEEKALQEARIRLFQPLWDVLQDVINLPAKKPSRSSASDKATVRDHLVYDNTYDRPHGTTIEFDWGLKLYVNNANPPFIEYEQYKSKMDRRVSQDEAMRLLVARLSEIIILPDEQT